MGETMKKLDQMTTEEQITVIAFVVLCALLIVAIVSGPHAHLWYGLGGLTGLWFPKLFRSAMKVLREKSDVKP